MVGRGRRGLVLIHGAAHPAACWAPTVADLASQAPASPRAPGRSVRSWAPPGDLRTLTVEQCVDAVAEEIERARLDEVVLVAHSMGGLTAPGVVARLGPAHVVRLVLIAALVLPAGGSVLDTLRGPVRWHVARAHRRATPRPPPPRTLARWLFCNGMTREQRDIVLEQLSAEHGPRKQRTSIDSLGGVGEIVEVDTGHDIMVSQPARSDPSHGTERRMTATGPRLTPRRAWSPEDGVGG